MGARRSAIVPWLAMLVTLAVWVGFVLVTRSLSHSPLTTVDAALIRFGLPAVVLLAVLPREWRALRRIRPLDALALAAGAGLPFFAAAAFGASLTSAATLGALVSGASPLVVALLERRGRPAPRTLAGLVAIGVAVVLLVAPQAVAADGAWLLGAVVLAAACVLWSLYTVALRRTTVGPTAANLVVCLPSALVALALELGGAVPSGFPAATAAEILPVVLALGVGSGLVGGVLFGVAVRGIGPRSAAVVGSLAPALSALLAVVLLGEPLGAWEAVAIVLLTVGVLLAAIDPGAAGRKAAARAEHAADPAS